MSKGLQRDGNKNLKKKGRFPRAPGFDDLGARDVSETLTQDQQPWVLLTLTSQLCSLEQASGPLPRALPQGAGTFPGQAAGRAQRGGGFLESTLYSESTLPSWTYTAPRGHSLLAWSQVAARCQRPTPQFLFPCCRCRGRGDGIFQVGDRGPEAVAAKPLEHPGSWQGPRDLCGPWPAEWQQVTFPTPCPPPPHTHPTPPQGYSAGLASRETPEMQL